MERIDREQLSNKDQTRNGLAIVLIVIGVLWIVKQTGFLYGFPFFHINHIFAPVGKVFGGLAHIVFSWQMVLILVGLVLMAGRRSSGLVLLIIGGIFLLPGLFVFSGAVFFLLLPLLLIGVGIAIVAHIF